MFQEFWQEAIKFGRFGAGTLDVELQDQLSPDVVRNAAQHCVPRIPWSRSGAPYTPLVFVFVGRYRRKGYFSGSTVLRGAEEEYVNLLQFVAGR
jgi:hypothetical protein